MGARSERVSPFEPDSANTAEAWAGVPPVAQSQSAIVVGIAGSARSWQALAWAAAEAHDRCCMLRIVHVVRWPPLSLNTCVPPGDLVGAALSAGGLVVEEAESQARSIAPALRIDTVLELGEPVSAILRHNRGDAMIVLGQGRRRQLWPLLYRSMVKRIARRAQCPVAVVALHDEVAGRSAARVVALVDSRGECRATLDFAFDAAERRGVGLTVVRSRDTCGDAIGGGTDPILEWHRRAFPSVDVQELVLADPIGAALVAAARGAAVVAVGESVRRPVRRALFTHRAVSILGLVVLVRTSPARSPSGPSDSVSRSR